MKIKNECWNFDKTSKRKVVNIWGAQDVYASTNHAQAQMSSPHHIFYAFNEEYAS